VLSEVQRLLVVRAKERFSRLMLNWPYGGGTAEVMTVLVVVLHVNNVCSNV
jgi:hypothetical protein